jgi:hypothetical protein
VIQPGRSQLVINPSVRTVSRCTMPASSSVDTVLSGAAARRSGTRARDRRNRGRQGLTRPAVGRECGPGGVAASRRRFTWSPTTPTAPPNGGATGRGRWTAPQTLALVVGIVYTLIGVVGFFLTGFDDFAGHEGHSLLGFEVNPLHNAVHVLIGVLGLLLSRRLSTARAFGWLLPVRRHAVVDTGPSRAYTAGNRTDLR